MLSDLDTQGRAMCSHCRFIGWHCEADAGSLGSLKVSEPDAGAGGGSFRQSGCLPSCISQAAIRQCSCLGLLSIRIMGVHHVAGR